MVVKVFDDKLVVVFGLFKVEEKKDKLLFDFEEIVKNVFDFVGGVFCKVKVDGVDDEKFKGMLGDVCKGV